MKTEIIRCPKCGSAAAKAATRLGVFCPVCVLGAGRTPVSDCSEPLTTWADVFPQLDVETPLRESQDFTAYRARVIGEDEASHAVLQIVSGDALRKMGGASVLQTRAQRLAATCIDGVAPVLDYGDLADAFFLVTAAPDQPSVTENIAAISGDELTLVLDSITSDAEVILQAGKAARVPLRFESELCFIDEDTGRLLLTPPLLVGKAPAEKQREADFLLVPGRRLGVFELQEQAGEGGFGEVWRARQDQPVERQVAVKILKQGLHSQRARVRFELEQQALAQLDHPHIARFFDGGTTSDGRPFFAMEWIDGQPITKFCSQSKASLDERLRLFREVCDAVQHAHQKGIIHRDLKPSNVMVTSNGELPSAKVIDFGIAHALDDSGTDRTLLTRAEEILGTPIYMSPEQAAGAGSAVIDARTDVYGLGVMLYELLTGALPFDPKLSLLELHRAIQDDEPLRPSQHITEHRFQRRVCGDLDWIVIRCLQKDPARRYQSVGALLLDIGRHARNEPVEAGPPEWSYRMRKFVRRQRFPLLAGGVVAVALVVATVVSLIQSRKASAESVHARMAEQSSERRRVEAKEAEESATAVSRFLIDIFSSPNPEKDGRNITVAETLDRATEKLRGDANLSPKQRVTLLGTLGQTYVSLGLRAEGITLLEEAWELEQELAESGKSENTEMLLILSNAYVSVGRWTEAEETLLELVSRLNRLLGPEHQDVLGAKQKLATAYIEQKRLPEAREILEEVAAVIADVFGAESSEFSDAAYYLSLLAQYEGNSHRAIELYKKVKPHLFNEDGFYDAPRTIDLNNIGLSLIDLGRIDEGISFLKMSLAMNKMGHGVEHPSTLSSMGVLAAALDNIGRSREANVIFREALASCRRNLDPDHLTTLATLNNMALNCSHLGQHEESLLLFEEILPRVEELRGLDHPHTIITRRSLAQGYDHASRYEEAIPLWEAVIDGLSETKGPDHHATLSAIAARCRPLIRIGRWAEAIPILESVIPQLKANSGSSPKWFVAQTQINLANGYMYAGRFADAADTFEKSLPAIEDAMSEARGRDREGLATWFIWSSLPVCYRKLGRHEEAIELLRRVAAMHVEVFGAGHKTALMDEYRLAVALSRGGHSKEAIASFESLPARSGDDSERPDQLTVLGRLAQAYGDAGRPADRERVLEEREVLATEKLEAAYDSLIAEGSDLTGTIIPNNSVWRWFRPDERDNPGGVDADFLATFYQPDFDDSTWRENADSLVGGFGYGDYLEQWIGAIDLGTPQNRQTHQAAFFRHRFTTDRRYDHLELHLQHDDGVVIFLDGEEVARENILDGSNGDGLHARLGRSYSDEWTPTRITLPDSLEPGEHVLAISLQDHDRWVDDLRLAGVTLVAREEEYVRDGKMVKETAQGAEDYEDSETGNIRIESKRLAVLAWWLAGESLKNGNLTEEHDRLLLSAAADLSTDATLFLREFSFLPQALHRLISVDSSGAQPQYGGHGLQLVERGSSWQFFSPNQKTAAPPEGWSAPGFDGSEWPTARAPLGYGDDVIVGAVAAGGNMNPSPLSVYFRKSFNNHGVNSDGILCLWLRADDGAAVYLNGEEILRARLPDDPLDPETLATRAITHAAEAFYQPFLLSAQRLRVGKNLLAVEVHQKGAKSSDLIFDLSLSLSSQSRESLAAKLRSAFQSFQGEAVLEDLRQSSSIDLPDLPPGWRDRVDAQLFALAGNWEKALAAADRFAAAGELDGSLARFRWHCLRQLDRKADAATAITEAIPQRDRDATPMQLDLTNQYNASLDEELWLMKDGNNWMTGLGAVPTGLQEFKGIRFDLRGVLQITGTLLQQSESESAISYPESVEGIEVGRSVARLHFLHSAGCAGAAVPVGDPIARYLIHYADGTTEMIPIRYKIDIGDDFGPSNIPTKDIDYQIAWEGPILGRTLYLKTWENPRPGVPIKSIDVISAMDGPSLYVLAITGEWDR